MLAFVAFVATLALPASSSKGEEIAIDLSPAMRAAVWRGDRHSQQGGHVDNGADGSALQLRWSQGSRRLMEVMFPDRPAIEGWSAGQSVSLWLLDEAPGSVRAVALRIADENDEVFQITARLDANADGWQRVSYQLDAKSAERIYGGDGNKRIDGQPKWFGLVTITQGDLDKPVMLWVSGTKGGKPGNAAGAASADAPLAANAEAPNESLSIEEPSRDGSLPVTLVSMDRDRLATVHAARRKKQSASSAERNGAWRAFRWEAGAPALMEVIFSGRPDLFAFDKGVTLSIPVETSGLVGFEKMAVRLVDAKGETFQWPARVPADASGWRDVRIDLGTSPYETNYGGPAEGKGQIDVPVRLGSLLLVNPSGEPGHVNVGAISRNDFRPEDVSVAARLARVSIELEETANVPLFRADEQEPVSVVVRNTGQAEATFDLELAFEHFDGSTLSWSRPGLRLAPETDESLLVEGLLEKTGWYRLSSTLVTPDGRVAKDSRMLLYLEPAGPRSHPPVEGFWLGIDARVNNTRQNAWQAELASLIGADFLRAGLTWPRSHPQRGQFKAEGHDAIMDMLEANGLKSVTALTFTPPWAIAEGAVEDLKRRIAEKGLSLPDLDSPSRLPPDPDAWRDYVREIAAHNAARGLVVAYELWNEPDLSGFYRGTTEQFLELQRIAAEEVREHHPEAILLSGGVATVLNHGGHNLNPDLIERNIVESQDYYDAVCLHQHGTFDIFERAVDGPFADYRAQVREDKPIFFTETGMWTEDDRHRQAHELVKKITYGRARGAIGFTWFVMRMRHEDRYAMLTGDRYADPFPQVAAFNELAKMMRGRSFVKQHDAGTGAWLLEFEGEGDRVVVAWAQQPQAVGQTVVFAVPSGGSAKTVDIMGNATPLSVTDGLATIELEGDVCYVVLTGPDTAVGGALASIERTPIGVPEQQVEVAALLGNPTQQPLTFDLTWSAAGSSDANQTITVPAGTVGQRVTHTLALPRAAAAGQDQPTLTLTYRVNDGLAVGSLETPLGVAQLIPASSIDGRSPDFVLDELNDTIVNVNQADPNRARFVWTGPSDLSASIWLTLENDAIVLVAEVKDDVHLQPNVPGAMWRADGLQFAMQASRDATMWEFGVGLRDDGPAVATYLSASADLGDPSSAFDVTVEPIDGGLSYRLAMPLEALGMTLESLRRDGLRFGLVVNDDDGGGREGWAQISDGIARGKDASKFPLVIFE
ncbi:MAG: hypothetical protein AAF561_04875 [Planctomycetota bacterium]